MKIKQSRWTEDTQWAGEDLTCANQMNLVFVFGSGTLLQNKGRISEVKSRYPEALICGCSTAGEIRGTEVTDDTLVVTAVAFEHTTIKGAVVNISDVPSSYEAGRSLASKLEPKGLVHAFVLSDGLRVNGSELVQGLIEHLPTDVTLTGGLSGDGSRFSETFVLWGEEAKSGVVAVVGLYGDRLKVGHGSLGGWDSFGTERLVTRSKANVLFELDGQPALDLYKKYLGEHAEGLPATGLLFPLSVREEGSESGVVRTILAVSEAEGSITFAGDVPQGSYARLMKANFDRLIDGATGAAKTSLEKLIGSSAELAILISCVGRKMVLQQRVEEEVEGVREILGEKTVLTGFYSYGEISPFQPSAKCELHNQTMTITTFSER